MNFIGESNIRVVLKISFCYTMHLRDFLNDSVNGVFNRVCYDVFKENWDRSKDELEEFFLPCIQSAYRTAWNLLVKMDYNADWGTDDKDVNKFISPAGEIFKEPPVFCSAFLQAMLPILYHILKNISSNYSDWKRENIKNAVCFQIRRKLVTPLGEYKYFADLNEAFGHSKVDILSVALESNSLETAVGCAKTAAMIAYFEKNKRRADGIILTNPIENNTHVKVREYTEATNDEVDEAIRRIAPIITAKRHWNGVVLVLLEISAFRSRIDVKHPHRGGQHEKQIKKFVVAEIEEQAKKIDSRWGKIYNDVKSLKETYPKVQKQFRSILEEILTT